jgi:hypothetical protein
MCDEQWLTRYAHASGESTIRRSSKLQRKLDERTRYGFRLLEDLLRNVYYPLPVATQLPLGHQPRRDYRLFTSLGARF